MGLINERDGEKSRRVVNVASPSITMITTYIDAGFVPSSWLHSQNVPTRIHLSLSFFSLLVRDWTSLESPGLVMDE